MSNWRLPTITELHDVFDYDTGNHKVVGFKRGYYWSSNTDPKNEQLRYVICFDKGWTTICMPFDVKGNKRNELKFYIRCVRKNGDTLEWSKSNPKPVNFEEALNWCDNLESGVYIEE